MVDSSGKSAKNVDSSSSAKVGNDSSSSKDKDTEEGVLSVLDSVIDSAVDSSVQDVAAGRPEPEGGSDALTHFPEYDEKSYCPKYSDISEAEGDMESVKDGSGDSLLKLADSAISTMQRRKRSGDEKKPVSKKKVRKDDPDLISKFKQYKKLKTDLLELEKVVEAGRLAEHKVRMSLLVCGMTESDLDEGVDREKEIGPRRNLFNQFRSNSNVEEINIHF